MTKQLLKLLLAASLVCSGMLIAQRPVQNIDPHRHPHLAAAQRLAAEAFDKITEAQEANRYDMEGHAQRAKGLLERANQELKLAAEAANHHRR